MAVTPNYSWPYQTLADAPDGADLGEAGFTEADATVAGIDARVVVAEAALSVLTAWRPYEVRQTLAAPAASVTFLSIPSSLRRLKVFWTARADNAVQAQQMFLRVNGVSSAVYDYEFLQGNNVTAAAFSSGSVTRARVGVLTGASASAGVFGSGSCEFVGWDSPHSTALGFTFRSQALGSAVASFFHDSGGGVYFNTGPYVSLTLFPEAGNFIAGSDFQLEGWRT